ncbi:MAG: IS66 family insertion sequence element accessory protein TnpB [Bacteroidales bacterium]|nr:IS66 family insertion sequence element accessory protein TnpB [Bacteroidales bacterium]MDZ4204806.1 IS66 family insertion sequence element accessory protein TnpB [Bacteroidales bacterium]
MFSITSARYFLYREPTDMRKSFDGLCGLISGRLGHNAMSSDLFIFINKPRNRIKFLRWEPGGFVLFYKRLEKGTFELPKAQNTCLSQTIEYSELVMIVTGISLEYAKKRRRFYQQNIVGNLSLK